MRVASPIGMRLAAVGGVALGLGLLALARRRQAALFSPMSSPEATMDRWLAAHPALSKRVIVPAALKWEIRDQLDQANINERVLFPGLDGLSRWLTRYYWPQPRTLRQR